jgi:tetrapyrrole methylase family protein/MazG family protein
MQSVTFSLPALMRAQKIQKKASSVGFEWDEPTQAMDKIIEEVEELKGALSCGDQEAIREEFGDLLLIISHVASMLKLDAEQVLMESIDKFVNRFKFIEDRLIEEGITPNPLIRDRMEALWAEAKKA